MDYLPLNNNRENNDSSNLLEEYNDEIDDYSYNERKIQKKSRPRRKKIIIIILIIILIIVSIISYIIYTIYQKIYECIPPVVTDEYYSKIKGEPFKDKFGIDLNQYIEKEIYSQNIAGNDKSKDKLENWNLYTPICPNLEPVHYPDEILNPNCEESSLQFTNFYREKGTGIPHTLHLHNITTQIKNFNEWNKKKDKDIPDYRNAKVDSLTSDEYHPFDYGYYDEKETKLKNEEDIISYYKRVGNSRMDEVPDPRHRRVFSFFLFNTEFDVLDVYLSTYYEIFNYFVIYESNVTFSGKPKPLYLTRVLTETNRYDKFKDKIITFVLPTTNACASPFGKEHYARRKVIEMGLRAVKARHGDIYIHGDLDEFPKPHIVTRLKKCGGWEHVQAGIGGGPKSTREKKVDSYFQDQNLLNKIGLDQHGSPNVIYERVLAICFLSWSYKYSFKFLERNDIPAKTIPNLAIFDARRSLGQLPEGFSIETDENNERNENKKRSDDKITENELNNNTSLRKRDLEKYDESSYVDPLTQPNFDPYKGYTSRYPIDRVRSVTFKDITKFYGDDDATLWYGGWHISSFLPTVDHFIDKIMSYSHYDRFLLMSEEKRRQYMIEHINKGEIYDEVEFYNKNTITFPESPDKSYKYDFTYKTWMSYNTDKEKYKEAEDLLKHEIPLAIAKNPICYSYMMDREFGLNKQLWWQVIPKEEWDTVDFDKLDKETLEAITPSNIPESFKPKPLRNEF